MLRCQVIMALVLAVAGCAFVLRDTPQPTPTAIVTPEHPYVERKPPTTPESIPTLANTIGDPRITELQALGIILSGLHCEPTIIGTTHCNVSVASYVTLDRFVTAVGQPDKVGSTVFSPVEFIRLYSK
ncbi:MAG: hypothetical protein HZB53_16315 [Chloroflexi bacterium]|nr:hypothetical protein [Chloroflexota bacterium]